MTKFAATDLCWIKRRAVNGVLYKMLRCKLTGSASMIVIYHSFI